MLKPCKFPYCHNKGKYLVGTLGERACSKHTSITNPQYMRTWWFWLSSTSIGMLGAGILLFFI